MGRMKHWPTCPSCGTSGPHTVVSTLKMAAVGSEELGDKLLRCMDCSHVWNHDQNKREREVNFAWASNSGSSK